MLGKVSSQLKPATCILDPIPTSFIKTFYSSFKDDLLNIVNYSLQMGVFPTALKTAAVKPPLKGNNLDPSILNNYKPVSDIFKNNFRETCF